MEMILLEWSEMCVNKEPGAGMNKESEMVIVRSGYE